MQAVSGGVFYLLAGLSLANAKGKAVFTELGPSWELVPPRRDGRALEGSAEPGGTLSPCPCQPLCFLQ